MNSRLGTWRSRYVFQYFVITAVMTADLKGDCPYIQPATFPCFCNKWHNKMCSHVYCESRTRSIAVHYALLLNVFSSFSLCQEDILGFSQ